MRYRGLPPQVADCWGCGQVRVDRVAARNGLCIECTVLVEEPLEQPDDTTETGDKSDRSENV